MATGLKHDKATKFWSVLFGLGVSLFTDYKTGVIAGTSFGIGGLWLSPDLDTNSRPLKRWGPLKLLWFPYRKLIPHRSWLSHGPLIGNCLRISYLFITIGILVIILKILGLSMPYDLSNSLFRIIKQNPMDMVTILISLEMSALLHLFQDKNPIKINLIRKGKK